MIVGLWIAYFGGEDRAGVAILDAAMVSGRYAMAAVVLSELLSDALLDSGHADRIIQARRIPLLQAIRRVWDDCELP
jgi:hypothetical protein